MSFSSLQEFEEKMKAIFASIAEYGIKKNPFDFSKSVSPEDRTAFITAVHEGYRLGQEMILEEMLTVLKFEKELAKDRKEKRADKEIISIITTLQNANNNRETILRNMADYMAWAIFKNQFYIARRFYRGDRSRPNLLSNNLESLLIAMKRFHNEDPRNFCLLTDLTSFIDIGDLLMTNGNKYHVIECKSGVVQKKVFEIIDELAKDDFSPEKMDYTGITPKMFDQVERTLRQMEKSAKLDRFSKEEKGMDPFKKTMINVAENDKPNRYYFDVLRGMIKQARENQMAQAIVEDTLFLVAFSGEPVSRATEIVNDMVEQVNPKLYAVEYVGLLHVPLKEPVFFKPIGKECIFDLLFNRLRIFVALDFDKLFEKFSEKGITAAWATRKQTATYLAKKDQYRPFVRDNQAITLSANGKSLVLGDGFLVHLLYDNLLPSSLIDRYVLMFKKMAGEDQK